MEAWLTILTSVLTSAGVTSGVMTVIQSRISHKYQKAMETYKHELSASNERQKFDYQRWVTDFGLFTQKKHETYAELYKLILIADGSLERLSGFMSVSSFAEYTRADMEEYLRNQHVIEGFIPQLMEKWESTRDDCIIEIREYLTMIDFQKANKARGEASNYNLINSVYFSGAVEETVAEILTLIGDQHAIDYQSRVEHYTDESSRKERKEIKEKKPTLIRKLKDLMRKEMSAGYYTEKPANLSDSIGATTK